MVKNKRGGKMKGRGKNCEEEREYKKGKEKKVIENGMRERRREKMKGYEMQKRINVEEEKLQEER